MLDTGKYDMHTACIIKVTIGLPVYWLTVENWI